MVEQLRADQFLERLVTLGLVVHDLRAVGFAVRAFLELSRLDVLGWSRKPDFPGVFGLRPETAGQRVEVARGTILIRVETGILEEDVDRADDPVDIFEIADVFRPEKVRLGGVGRISLEIGDAAIAAGVNFEHAGVAVALARRLGVDGAGRAALSSGRQLGTILVGAAPQARQTPEAAAAWASAEASLASATASSACCWLLQAVRARPSAIASRILLMDMMRFPRRLYKS